MTEQQEMEQLRSVCDGIRLLYHARQSGIQRLYTGREAVVQRARDMRIRIGQENSEDTRNFLRRELSAIVSELSEIDRAIGAKMEQFSEIENDFDVNQCQALVGSL